MSRKIELLILGLFLLIATGLVFRSYEKKKYVVPETVVPKVVDAEKGKVFEVVKVTVLRGDVLDLTIKGKDRILAKLNVVATDDAKDKLIDLLNESTNPKVILREKQTDGRWVVDFLFTHKGKEVNLTEWLVTNNLVYK